MGSKNTTEMKEKKESNKAATSTASATSAKTQYIAKDFQEAYTTSMKSYWDQIASNNKLKLIDLFCAFLVVVGIIQFAFVCLIRDNYPFNAFLAGFIICVGQFVLLISLRLQLLNPFEGIPKNRAFGEFVLASLILHFICIHFIN
ncbi:dolichyl-diphosphooligosaccharide-protein glycotransferase NDAI_0F02630 [Naumovozyma dairenensis CBS 421]|uniref:Dolichyl-diphosphooligosaccharide--protein glycosyltransferase subunit OST2 n=1 Tax=Naumovozyma dairenensis (strain ATCC 10597 / BCRC 20456 / CBS 421 / NBRC 0211 / NRRL Y-12639) TaxID=1071378 RepID=G0WCS0_NAUDC|nr:hypothetical protein NDAI_0F02630 [Naumovozyma dairenensis CBS 421]CCD25581.1 hypothetical protein NDAI_0F02630 [Naumovozyma dairenensis CBS 421]